MIQGLYVPMNVFQSSQEKSKIHIERQTSLRYLEMLWEIVLESQYQLMLMMLSEYIASDEMKVNFLVEISLPLLLL